MSVTNTSASLNLGLNARGRRGTHRLSPRRRARAARGAQYAILLVLVIVIAATTDWGSIAENLLNPTALARIAPRIPPAFANTVIYAAGAFGFGLVLGLVLALMKLSSVSPYRWLATCYIEFFRGVPALLVVIAMGYAVPLAFNVKLPSIMVTIWVALGLVSAAYVSETLRAGIQAVPRGQVEAARSLGMSKSRTLASVVIPQALRIVLPPLTNELIVVTKDTSLVYLLGMATSQFELSKLGKDALNMAGGGLSAIVVIGLAYLLITVPLGLLSRWLERRGSKAHTP